MIDIAIITTLSLGILFMLIAVRYYIKNDVGMAVKEIKMGITDEDQRDYTKDIESTAPEMEKINIYDQIRSSDFKNIKDDRKEDRPSVLSRKKEKKNMYDLPVRQNEDATELLYDDSEATEFLSSEDNEATEYLGDTEKTEYLGNDGEKTELLSDDGEKTELLGSDEEVTELLHKQN